MPDPRIRRWAETLTNYCLYVKPGETVGIYATPLAGPLVEEVYRAVLRAGGHPLVRLSLPELTEVFLKEASDEQLTYVSPVDEALAETLDARLRISSEANVRALANVDPARQALFQRSGGPAARRYREREQEGKFKWCGTLYPTQASAQNAEMSLADFTEFVFEACFLNDDNTAERWRDLGHRQQRYVDWLKGKERVRVVGRDTDLTLSIAGRTFINSDGKRNFPSGEFFTGPVEESVEGTIRYTIPSSISGRVVQDVTLRFHKGEVVEARAVQGQEFLEKMLNIDAGARRVGEFAVGNNFGITRGICNTLFDEKIGGTIHMALGDSYPETGGLNKSALHWDLVCDLRPAAGGGEVWVDDELFLKDGKLMIGA
ncbi:MAG TPA: aminopeptidase [Ktedonobacterales bacterium]|jgi:aminopeptidase